MFWRDIFRGRNGWWAPLLLVVLGFFVRAAYYQENYGHPDETITVEVLRYMRHSGLVMCLYRASTTLFAAIESAVVKNPSTVSNA